MCLIKIHAIHKVHRLCKFFLCLSGKSYDHICSQCRILKIFSKKITFFKSRMGLPPLMVSYSDGDFFPACWK